jgi:hypothetical protein
MLKRLLSLTIVALAPAALAQKFLAVEPLGLDLSRQREVAIAQADVVVGLKTIEAPHGVRCGEGAFEPRVVTTLERDCEVRLGSGETRSIFVTFEGHTLAIHLQPGKHAGPRLLGEYVQRSARINGQETAANFGTLRLMEDGRYSIGYARGRWSKRGASFGFDGPIAHWSVTHLADGELQFTFLRGPLEYTIVYARAPAAEQLRAER